MTRPADATALRLLFTLALSPRELAELRATHRPERALDVLWPSALVAELVEQLADDPDLWRAVAGRLDRRLAPWLVRLAARPAREVLGPLDDAGSVPALAARLWSLARRREPALAQVLARLACELERLIVAEAGRHALSAMSPRTCDDPPASSP